MTKKSQCSLYRKPSLFQLYRIISKSATLSCTMRYRRIMRCLNHSLEDKQETPVINNSAIAKVSGKISKDD